MFKRLTGSLRSKILFSFLLGLIPLLIFIIAAVELLLVPSIGQSVREQLTNSTRVLASTVRTSASVAIRNHLKAIAEINLEIARHHLSLVKQGRISREQAVARLRTILLSQQVGSSGYLYCLNSDGNVPVHPNPEVEGTNASEFDFVREQMHTRQGYLEYDWQNPGESSPRPKALYMVYFEPLDWIISASSYRSEFSELINHRDFRETVLSLRFGSTGYAYLMNTDGTVLIHPKYDDFNVFDAENVPADFFREMVRTGSGILEYHWQNPDEKRARRKLAVYEKIPQYDWLIVSSAYVSEVLRPVWMARVVAHSSILLLLCCIAAAAYYFSGRISRPVDLMLDQLDRNAREGTYRPLPVPDGGELERLAREFNAYLEVLDRQNEAIRQQQLRYRNLFEASPDAILLMHGLRIADCNPAASLIFEASKEELLARTVLDLSPPLQPDGQNSQVLAERITRDSLRLPLQTFDWEHQTLDGRSFQAEVRFQLMSQVGEQSQQVAFVRDVTERRLSENALRESELKYRQLIENASDAIFIIQNERIIYANQRTTELSGYRSEELKSQPFSELVHPEDLPKVVDRHRRRLQGENIVSMYTFRFIAKDGSTKTAQLNAVRIDWNDRPATLNFVRDVSDLKRMEAAFQEAQKLEAVGTLAGGIAHDFNNLLMGIQGRVSLLQAARQLSGGDEHLEAIEEYIKSASGLTRQLLGFARGGKYDPRPIDINRLVENSAAMFGRTHKEIEMIVETAAEPVVVEIDKPQFEQVLLNLYLNAWQAMTDSGEIRIGTEIVALDGAFCESYGIPAGRYGRILVADTGSGIDAEVQQRIFDPFYTTKDKERGTGLGLASTYGIIQNHCGAITVDSVVGRGTTFSIYLPVSDQEPQLEAAGGEELVTGTETVLLVDDEEMIRQVGEAMLEQLGYRAIVAESGRKALAMLGSEQLRVDLVVLDLVMPDLDGVRTLTAIREIDTRLPVILSSGYAVDGQAAVLLKQGSCSDFIQKPFSIAEFSRTIRRVLDLAKESVK